MLNTNTIHNVLNILISLSALFVAVLLATGCSQFSDGMLECSQSFLSPQITAFVIAGLSALKVAINVVRDGLSGLVKPQPPVSK
ncbi:hypothetical protein [Rhizobium sp. BK602]|uniref:hypothetical protein n=1 Tax=Rhizobium sp. BK602 TaxID=2586986 RepID=UPI00160CDF3B|nr:hypothetical protein [Rhizobium sp. BK602]